MVTKPVTKTLADHLDLVKAAEENGVFVCVAEIQLCPPILDN